MADSKYVPPPLRGGPGSVGSNDNDSRSRGSNSGRSFGSRSRGGYGGRGGGFGGRGGGFGGRGGGFGGRGGGFGGRGYGRRVARANELGFHGSMDENRLVEKELFSAGHSAGINFDKYDDIPVETSGNDIPDSIDVFDEKDLGLRLMTNIKLAKFTKPTPVQKYSLPIGLADRDLMACAQTGSGKTGGFLFPVIAQMLRKGPLEPSGANPRDLVYPTAVILAPTRELAIQIHEEAMKFCYRTGIAPVVVYGGDDFRRQVYELQRGCDIIIATPGRLIDHMERRTLSLECVRFLVLDEADRMLDMGFEPQIKRIVLESDMPKQRQTFMFSATFPRQIQLLASAFLTDYVFLTVGRVGSASKDVKQRIEYVEEHRKVEKLVEHLMPLQDKLVLVFVERKKTCDVLEYELRRAQFPCIAIHGDRSQRERMDALSRFKNRMCPILIATDVASRGLDIEDVSYVINFDMPSNIDDYVHRIGRTGRVGNTGTAISYMNETCSNIAFDLLGLLEDAKQEVPSWLYSITKHRGGGRGGGRGRGRGRGGSSRFGGRDFRRETSNMGGSSGGGRGGRGGFSGPSAYGGRGGAAAGGAYMGGGGARGGFSGGYGGGAMAYGGGAMAYGGGAMAYGGGSAYGGRPMAYGGYGGGMPGGGGRGGWGSFGRSGQGGQGY